MVVVESRAAPALQDLRDLGVRDRGAEQAPAVDDMHLGRFAAAIRLDDADRPGIGPFSGAEAREGRARAREMQVEVFDTGASAAAAADLAPEARPGAPALDA